MFWSLFMFFRQLDARSERANSDDCEPCWLHDLGIGECHGCGQ